MSDHLPAPLEARRRAIEHDVTAVRAAFDQLDAAYAVAVKALDHAAGQLRTVVERTAPLQRALADRAEAFNAEAARWGVTGRVTVPDLIGEARTLMERHSGPLASPWCRCSGQDKDGV